MDFCDVFTTIILVIFALLFVFIACTGLYAGFYEGTKVEIETYTTGCEVTQMAYAEETTGRSSSRPSYKMGVRNDDFATTFDVTDAQFAKYAIGDVVEVEVIVYEYRDGMHRNEYKLIG